MKPIERNVLERVQEFDSGDAESIAKSIINEAIEEKIDIQEAMTIAHEMVDEGQQLSLGQEPEHIADLEFAEALNLGETLAPEGVATDEDILAAELELDRGWGDDGPAYVSQPVAGQESTDETPAAESIAAHYADDAADIPLEGHDLASKDESSNEGSAEV